MLFSQHYYVFPEIEYLNSGSGDNILVKYHAETILLSNSSNNDEKKLDYYKKYSADKIITNFWNGCTIKFNKDLIISVPPNYGKQYKTLDLNIHLKNEKIIFTRNAEAIEDFKNKYVIIEVPKKKYFGNNTSLVLSDKDFVKYEIIFKNVYLIK
jgi:hypothetical protein